MREGKEMGPATPDAGTRLPEALITIAENLSTQDSRLTDKPIFIVEQKVRDCGFDDDYCDQAVWVDSEGDEVSETRYNRLETLYDHGRQFRRGHRVPFRRVGVRDRWEFVTACFTEQGCKDYLRLNGHNLKETRIYAESSYRNNEFRAVRDFLLQAGLPAPERPAKGSPND